MTTRGFIVPGIGENEWAKGCGDCEFGLIDAPPFRESNRRAQAHAGELNFCDCKAGRMYEKHLTGKEVEWQGPSVHWDGPLAAHYGADD